MLSRTTNGSGRFARETPQHPRIDTLFALRDAVVAKLGVTSRWRPGTLRALLVPGSLPTPARLAYLLRPTGGEP